VTSRQLFSVEVQALECVFATRPVNPPLCRAGSRSEAGAGRESPDAGGILMSRSRLSMVSWERDITVRPHRPAVHRTARLSRGSLFTENTLDSRHESVLHRTAPNPPTGIGRPVRGRTARDDSSVARGRGRVSGIRLPRRRFPNVHGHWDVSQKRRPQSILHFFPTTSHFE